MKSLVCALILCVVVAHAHDPRVCVGHDQPCFGDHGTQGNCCSGLGLYCHKTISSWAEGRCYYNFNDEPNTGIEDRARTRVVETLLPVVSSERTVRQRTRSKPTPAALAQQPVFRPRTSKDPPTQEYVGDDDRESTQILGFGEGTRLPLQSPGRRIIRNRLPDSTVARPVNREWNNDENQLRESNAVTPSSVYFELKPTFEPPRVKPDRRSLSHSWNQHYYTGDAYTRQTELNIGA